MKNINISEYLENIGIYKADSMEELLEEKFGKEKALQVVDNWERLSNEADQSDNPGRQDALYEYLNEDYDLSMAVSCYTDAEIIKTIGQWISDHEDYFKGDILEVGCGTGILSCYIASAFPEKNIISFDRSANCINVANQLKKRLELDNIRFVCGDVSVNGEFQNIESSNVEGVANAKTITGKYETILSVRTVHENIGIRPTFNIFLPFSKQVEAYEEIYQDYINLLSGLAGPDGNLVCLERNHIDTEFYSVLKCFNRNGMKVLSESISELSCWESDFKEESQFLTFVLKKEQPEYSDQELFDIWSQKAFSANDELEAYTRAEADHYLESQAAEVISGYDTFDRTGAQLGRSALYKIKNLPDSFIMYQGNVRGALIRKLPLDALSDVQGSMADRKIIDNVMGFIVKDLLS